MSIQFNGSSQYITAASAAGIPTVYPLAVCCIVNLAALATWHGLFQVGNGSDGAGNGYYIEITSSNTIQFQIAAGNSAGSITTGTVVSGDWLFIGCAAASAASRRILCYNYETRATILNETFTDSKTIVAPAARFRLGAWGDTDTTFTDLLNGTMAWCAVYNIDLTIQSGAALLNVALLGPFAGATPTNLWPLWEGTGTTARDLVSGNAGTLTGSPTWEPMSLPGPWWARAARRVIRPQAAAPPAVIPYLVVAPYRPF